MLPRNSIRWPDNIAVQSVFDKNSLYPEYRSLQLTFKWMDEAETAIQAVNCVFLEKKKNWWYNNGGQNYQIPCALDVNKPTQDMAAGE